MRCMRGVFVERKQKLGTFLGVFLPCIQNIFGVLLFVRMPWIAGVAGGLQFFLMVGFCCLCLDFFTRQQ
ncbi:Solute carrier family 12 member 7 [Taenia solium]|eukprot:TsM_000176600 transcript=TsM_000176600 gene=TsM_000176600